LISPQTTATTVRAPSSHDGDGVALWQRDLAGLGQAKTLKSSLYEAKNQLADVFRKALLMKTLKNSSVI
jgi:hypothetical protein